MTSPYQIESSIKHARNVDEVFDYFKQEADKHQKSSLDLKVISLQEHPSIFKTPVSSNNDKNYNTVSNNSPSTSSSAALKIQNEITKNEIAPPPVPPPPARTLLHYSVDPAIDCTCNIELTWALGIDQNFFLSPLDEIRFYATDNNSVMSTDYYSSMMNNNTNEGTTDYARKRSSVLEPVLSVALESVVTDPGKVFRTNKDHESNNKNNTQFQASKPKDQNSSRRPSSSTTTRHEKTDEQSSTMGIQYDPSPVLPNSTSSRSGNIKMRIPLSVLASSFLVCIYSAELRTRIVTYYIDHDKMNLQPPVTYGIDRYKESHKMLPEVLPWPLKNCIDPNADSAGACYVKCRAGKFGAVRRLDVNVALNVRNLFGFDGLNTPLGPQSKSSSIGGNSSTQQPRPLEDVLAFRQIVERGVVTIQKITDGSIDSDCGLVNPASILAPLSRAVMKAHDGAPVDAIWDKTIEYGTVHFNFSVPMPLWILKQLYPDADEDDQDQYQEDGNHHGNNGNDLLEEVFEVRLLIPQYFPLEEMNSENNNETNQRRQKSLSEPRLHQERFLLNPEESIHTFQRCVLRSGPIRFHQQDATQSFAKPAFGSLQQRNLETERRKRLQQQSNSTSKKKTTSMMSLSSPPPLPYFPEPLNKHVLHLRGGAAAPGQLVTAVFDLDEKLLQQVVYKNEENQNQQQHSASNRPRIGKEEDPESPDYAVKEYLSGRQTHDFLLPNVLDRIDFFTFGHTEKFHRDTSRESLEYAVGVQMFAGALRIPAPSSEGRFDIAYRAFDSDVNAPLARAVTRPPFFVRTPAASIRVLSRSEVESRLFPWLFDPASSYYHTKNTHHDGNDNVHYHYQDEDEEKKLKDPRFQLMDWHQREQESRNENPLNTEVADYNYHRPSSAFGNSGVSSSSLSNDNSAALVAVSNKKSTAGPSYLPEVGLWIEVEVSYDIASKDDTISIVDSLSHELVCLIKPSESDVSFAAAVDSADFERLKFIDDAGNGRRLREDNINCVCRLDGKEIRPLRGCGVYAEYHSARLGSTLNRVGPFDLDDPHWALQLRTPTPAILPAYQLPALILDSFSEIPVDLPLTFRIGLPQEHRLRKLRRSTDAGVMFGGNYNSTTHQERPSSSTTLTRSRPQTPAFPHPAALPTGEESATPLNDDGSHQPIVAMKEATSSVASAQPGPSQIQSSNTGKMPSRPQSALEMTSPENRPTSAFSAVVYTPPPLQQQPIEKIDSNNDDDIIEEDNTTHVEDGRDSPSRKFVIDRRNGERPVSPQQQHYSLADAEEHHHHHHHHNNHSDDEDDNDLPVLRAPRPTSAALPVPKNLPPRRRPPSAVGTSSSSKTKQQQQQLPQKEATNNTNKSEQQQQLPAALNNSRPATASSTSNRPPRPQSAATKQQANNNNNIINHATPTPTPTPSNTTATKNNNKLIVAPLSIQQGWDLLDYLVITVHRLCENDSLSNPVWSCTPTGDADDWCGLFPGLPGASYVRPISSGSVALTNSRHLRLEFPPLKRPGRYVVRANIVIPTLPALAEEQSQEYFFNMNYSSQKCLNPHERAGQLLRAPFILRVLCESTFRVSAASHHLTNYDQQRNRTMLDYMRSAHENKKLPIFPYGNLQPGCLEEIPFAFCSDLRRGETRSRDAKKTSLEENNEEALMMLEDAKSKNRSRKSNNNNNQPPQERKNSAIINNLPSSVARRRVVDKKSLVFDTPNYEEASTTTVTESSPSSRTSQYYPIIDSPSPIRRNEDNESRNSNVMISSISQLNNENNDNKSSSAAAKQEPASLYTKSSMFEPPVTTLIPFSQGTVHGFLTGPKKITTNDCIVITSHIADNKYIASRDDVIVIVDDEWQVVSSHRLLLDGSTRKPNNYQLCTVSLAPAQEPGKYFAVYFSVSLGVGVLGFGPIEVEASSTYKIPISSDSRLTENLTDADYSRDGVENLMSQEDADKPISILAQHALRSYFAKSASNPLPAALHDRMMMIKKQAEKERLETQKALDETDKKQEYYQSPVRSASSAGAVIAAEKNNMMNVDEQFTTGTTTTTTSSSICRLCAHDHMVPKSGTLRALLVGCDYRSSANSSFVATGGKSSCGSRDVDLLHSALKTAFGDGVSALDVKTLKDPSSSSYSSSFSPLESASTSPSAQNIRHQLLEMIKKAKFGDSVLFYFSGFGALLHGRGSTTDSLRHVLVPSDVDWTAHRLIDLREIDAFARRIAAKVGPTGSVSIIVDAGFERGVFDEMDYMSSVLKGNATKTLKGPFVPRFASSSSSAAAASMTTPQRQNNNYNNNYRPQSATAASSQTPLFSPIGKQNNSDAAASSSSSSPVMAFSPRPPSAGNLLAQKQISRKTPLRGVPYSPAVYREAKERLLQERAAEVEKRVQSAEKELFEKGQIRNLANTSLSQEQKRELILAASLDADKNKKEDYSSFHPLPYLLQGAGGRVEVETPSKTHAASLRQRALAHIPLGSRWKSLAAPMHLRAGFCDYSLMTRRFNSSVTRDFQDDIPCARFRAGGTVSMVMDLPSNVSNANNNNNNQEMHHHPHRHIHHQEPCDFAPIAFYFAGRRAVWQRPVSFPGQWLDGAAEDGRGDESCSVFQAALSDALQCWRMSAMRHPTADNAKVGEAPPGLSDREREAWETALLLAQPDRLRDFDAIARPPSWSQLHKMIRRKLWSSPFRSQKPQLYVSHPRLLEESCGMFPAECVFASTSVRKN